MNRRRGTRIGRMTQDAGDRGFWMFVPCHHQSLNPRIRSNPLKSASSAFPVFPSPDPQMECVVSLLHVGYDNTARCEGSMRHPNHIVVMGLLALLLMSCATVDRSRRGLTMRTNTEINPVPTATLPITGKRYTLGQGASALSVGSLNELGRR